MKQKLATLVAVVMGLLAPLFAWAASHAGRLSVHGAMGTGEHLAFHDAWTGDIIRSGQWSALGDQAICAGETGIVGFLYGNGPVMALIGYYRLELVLGLLFATAFCVLWRLGYLRTAPLAWRRTVESISTSRLRLA